MAQSTTTQLRTEMRLAIEAEHERAVARIWAADAFDLLQAIEPESVSLIISSPPYFMGKEYDRSESPKEFVEQHERLFPLLARALKPGGSLCWQVGHHVREGRAIPLDALVYNVSTSIDELILRNRVVWTFHHGAHCRRRFSGRHETVLWFTKGDKYSFNLDAVRIPQRYPGKRSYKGPNKGDWSGNPRGKNPGDVWDIPNVKARHVEKTDHPCQFPTALVRRFVRALTNPGDVILDPFLGSGTSCVVALLEGRNFVGSEIEQKYIRIIRTRLAEVKSGNPKIRPDLPPRTPTEREAVARRPPHFILNTGEI